jgi:hypothetical protein
VACMTTVDGKYPSSLSLASIRRVTRAVRVLSLPPGETTLDFLLPVAGSIREILVTDWDCEDVRVISQMHSVRYVNLIRTDPKRVVQFDGLQSLARFAGPDCPQYRSVLKAPGLRDLALDKPKPDALLVVQAPLECLALLRASAVTSIPDSPALLGLRTLEVHGAKTLDISGLRQLSHLTDVEFTSVKRITGISALNRCPNLRTVTFENCAEVDDLDAFAELKARKIRLAGSALPVTAQFKKQVSAQNLSRWSFPPMLTER